MKATIKEDIFTTANMRKYFINLLTGEKYSSFHKAEMNFPMLGRIAGKLSQRELNYLIDKIEELS